MSHRTSHKPTERSYRETIVAYVAQFANVSPALAWDTPNVHHGRLCRRKCHTVFRSALSHKTQRRSVRPNVVETRRRIIEPNNAGFTQHVFWRHYRTCTPEGSPTGISRWGFRWSSPVVVDVVFRRQIGRGVRGAGCVCLAPDFRRLVIGRANFSRPGYSRELDFPTSFRILLIPR